MSRPADWSPLADADPVPGDPLEVASIGGQLANVAAQIHSDVTWLQSLCTAQFWDSGAGQAFSGQVNDAAAKLARAHERYLAAGQALGTSPAAPTGYASALDQAQALSVRALTQAQGAWAVMRTQLTAAEIANKGMVPYQGSNLYAGLNPAQPLLDSSGNPVLMLIPADATTPLRTAVARYNASALDYRTANGWLAEAVAARDAAAASAAAAIRAALGSDGLQDQTGLWHDITSTADAPFGWAEQHWAQVVGDIATVCGWIASTLGVLALVLAFIPGLQGVAALLEGMALTLTEITAICHLILALTGNGPWLDVGLDVVSLVTFGIGRAALRGAEGTVEVADDLSSAGAAARADRLSTGLTAGDSGVDDLSELLDDATLHEEVTIATKGQVARIPGKLGKFGKEAVRDLTPVSPAKALKILQAADWKGTLAGHPASGITKATLQAFHLTSPEIGEARESLEAVPGIEKITRLTGIQFSDTVTHYGHVWTASQATGLTTDIIDKVNETLTYFGSELPGYNWAKEQTRT